MEPTSTDDASAPKKTLTPAEVHNVAFKKPPIGKRGYDEEEVDYFLDVVETELSRLIEENERLQNSSSPQPLDEAQLAQATDQAVVAENQRLNEALQQLQHDHSQLGESHNQLQEAVQAAEQRAEAAQRDAENARAQAAAGGGGGGTGEPADHHQQAVKVLVLAQQTADQHLANAQNEAETTTREARATADQLHQQSTTEAQRVVEEAQARADQLRRESEEQAAKTVSDSETHAKSVQDALEGRKSALEKRLTELGTFEREYRSRLKSYLESQLRDLQLGAEDGDDSAADHAGEAATAPAK
jgi:DivIVA domain-containing protein